MTKKDYELIASAIAESAEDARGYPGAVGAVTQVGRRISSVLAKENPRFDRARFLAACGIQD